MRKKRKLSVAQKIIITMGVLLGIARMATFPIRAWVVTHPQHNSTVVTPEQHTTRSNLVQSKDLSK
jgi:hypothetical protein